MSQNRTKNLREMLGVRSLQHGLFVALLVVLTPFAHGQDLTALTADARRPGDVVRVVLTFDGPVKLSSANFRFNLRKLAEQAQKLWPSWINGGGLKPLSNPSQWEISGPVQEFTASGEYLLTSVSVSFADLSKTYSVPDIVQKPITLTIINDRKDPIPALRDVTLIPER